MDVNATLAERQKTHGDFEENAELSQALKYVMRNLGNWDELRPDQQEALEVIQHKIARILTGDPNLIDSYRDICGYSQLVVNRLERSDGARDMQTRLIVRHNGEWEAA